MRLLLLLFMLISNNVFAYDSNLEIESKYSAINIYPISFYNILPVKGIGPKKYRSTGYQLVLTRPYKISNTNYGLKKLELYSTASDKSIYRDSTDYGLIDRDSKTSYSKIAYCEYYLIFSSINSCLGGGLSQYSYTLAPKKFIKGEELIRLDRKKAKYLNILLTASFDYDINLKKIPFKGNFFIDYSTNPFEVSSPTLGYGLSLGLSI